MRNRLRWVAGGLGIAVLVALALAGLGAGGIVAWEYGNSDRFCATVCHAVHPEEPVAHAASAHARVNCVECHIGRLPTLQTMALKTQHTHEILGMFLGYERPLHATTLRPARVSCELCHSPEVVHRDTVVLKKSYATDERSTETTTRLVVHTGFGAIREGEAQGVHWHIVNPVNYVALDAQRNEIPWVQVIHSDGREEVYVDRSLGVDPADYADVPRRQMDCIDCHNQVGHPFPNPEVRVDRAIALGQLDRRRLPELKARAMRLVGAVEGLDLRGEATAEAIDELVNEAVREYRGILQGEAANAALAQFAEVMTGILNDSTFDAPDVTWRSFADHTGHRDAPGCFRCHNGKHVNDRGEPIRLQCTLCHDLPQVQTEGGLPPVLTEPGMSPPRSHLAPDFMRDHGAMPTARCSGCHGEIEFGTDNRSFCANEACHGRSWPGVDLHQRP